MAKRKTGIRHAEIVQRFAVRLREMRHSRGMTQAELARQAHVTLSYIGRLENGGAAPGIDLADRLAGALGTTLTELLPATPSDAMGVLRQRAETLFHSLLGIADRETLMMLNPLLARLVELRQKSRDQA